MKKISPSSSGENSKECQGCVTKKCAKKDEKQTLVKPKKFPLTHAKLELLMEHTFDTLVQMNGKKIAELLVCNMITADGFLITEEEYVQLEGTSQLPMKISSVPILKACIDAFPNPYFWRMAFYKSNFYDLIFDCLDKHCEPKYIKALWHFIFSRLQRSPILTLFQNRLITTQSTFLTLWNSTISTQLNTFLINDLIFIVQRYAYPFQISELVELLNDEEATWKFNTNNQNKNQIQLFNSNNKLYYFNTNNQNKNQIQLFNSNNKLYCLSNEYFDSSNQAREIRFFFTQVNDDWTRCPDPIDFPHVPLSCDWSLFLNSNESFPIISSMEELHNNFKFLSCHFPFVVGNFFSLTQEDIVRLKVIQIVNYNDHFKFLNYSAIIDQKGCVRDKKTNHLYAYSFEEFLFRFFLISHNTKFDNFASVIAYKKWHEQVQKKSKENLFFSVITL
jgi:hypothetical protein